MPTLKYKDPVTGEYKSDIHVVGAVSSVNGKTGVVNLDNSDITEALGYTPADDQTTQEKLIAGSGVTIAEDGKTISATGSVSDVQINGTSVVADGVANIKTGAGLQVETNGNIRAVAAAPSLIGARSSTSVIFANGIDYAVKAAMCDGKGSAWTPTEQAAARERMGADSAWNHVHLETAEEVIHMNAVIDKNATELIITGQVTKVNDDSAYLWFYPYVGSGNNDHAFNRPGPFTTQRTITFLADGYLIGDVERSTVSWGIVTNLGWMTSGFIAQFRTTGMIDITFGSVKIAAGSYVDIYYR